MLTFTDGSCVVGVVEEDALLVDTIGAELLTFTVLFRTASTVDGRGLEPYENES